MDNGGASSIKIYEPVLTNVQGNEITDNLLLVQLDLSYSGYELPNPSNIVASGQRTWVFGDEKVFIK